jgi:hypothetical protein
MKVIKASRILAGLVVAVLAVSCGIDKSPTAPPAPQPSLIGNTLGGVTNLVGSLLKCTPMRFDADTARVGPSGGILHMGPHYLVIPPNALTTTVTITASAPSDTVNSVRFGPEGLHFAHPAALVLDYSNCNLIAGLLTHKRIAYTTDGLHVITWIPSVDTPLLRKITGQLDHFSRYAVGW